eukprot:2644187-Amphidinium_carterae.3
MSLRCLKHVVQVQNCELQNLPVSLKPETIQNGSKKAQNGPNMIGQSVSMLCVLDTHHQSYVQTKNGARDSELHHFAIVRVQIPSLQSLLVPSKGVTPAVLSGRVQVMSQPPKTKMPPSTAQLAVAVPA